ncbi:MAG TPA: M1 family metallopeptidase, partial [Flavobacteriales bacterium]|nr:M1 family metallopeptidase [Flavobacteriales bacterium]
LHLWPNAYRDRSSALCRQLAVRGELDLHFATEEERGWIDSLDFRTDDRPLTWGYHPQHADIGWVKLPAPLPTGGAITISTPFRVKVPDSKFSRLGHTGQSYHITQWFPKPAVFDQSGWHAMPYLTQGEFYSEFGSYDVTITLPANYVVGATGLLQNEPERELMDRMASPEWKYPEPITDPRTGKPRHNQFPVSSTQLKTLRYVQDNVHDFAWFADKRFIVRKGKVVLPQSGRTVTTWALFTPKNADEWKAVGIESLNQSVLRYSEWVGEYPYAACTAVDGTISAGGGMEYPMITIIGNMGSTESLDNVIAHEVGHNWFYGILASNERDHPWMDEGMNSFVELRYMRLRYPNSTPGIGVPGERKLFGHVKDAHRFQSEAMYRLNARRNLDQPIALCAHDFSTLNYGAMVYGKSALVFDHLFAYLGDPLFDRCMHAYFEEWKFKHPRPEDVRRVFERETGKDLGWVFDGLIATDAKADVKALRMRSDQTFYLKNTGLDSIPVPITAWKGSDSLGTKWFMSTKDVVGHEHIWPNADRIRIDAGAHTLDIDRRNNEVRSHGLFRRWAKPEVKWFAGVEKDDRRSVYWTPVAAWNGHDGVQLGLAAYNTVFPSQRTEWVVAPLYGFASERIGGAARIEHHLDRLHSRWFQNIHLGLNLRSSAIFQDHGNVAAYEKVAPHILFDLKRDPLRKPWKHSIGLRGIYVNTTSSAVSGEAVDVFPASLPLFEQYNAELQYTARDDRKLGPTFVQLTVLAQDAGGASSFVRASIELKRAFTYNAEKKQLRLRAFAGTFLTGGDDLIDPLQAWGLSWGPEDLLYDDAYLERGAARSTFTGRQFGKQQGAFKTPFAQGGSDSWTASMNMELDFPFSLPLAAFASAGWVPLTSITTEGSSTSTASYFEAGLGIPVVRDVLEVWFPLYVSERIRDEEEFAGRDIGDRIRFVFALEKLDPTKALRRVRP